MGRASTEMREYQEEFTAAVEANTFTQEELRTMLLDAVRFMNPHELDRLLATAGRERWELS